MDTKTLALDAPTTTDDALTTTTPATVLPVPVPDVLPLPHGFASILAAVNRSGVNTSTDMGIDALRADIVTLARAMEEGNPGVPVPPKNRGRYTGLRTYDFQNTLFHVNDRAGWRVTDRTLLLIWAAELPANRCDFALHADYIGGTRASYRNGKHLSNILSPTVFTSKEWTVKDRTAGRAPRKASTKKA